MINNIARGKYYLEYCGYVGCTEKNAILSMSILYGLGAGCEPLLSIRKEGKRRKRNFSGERWTRNTPI